MACSARESKSPQFLKIERHAQRLSYRVCIGDTGSGQWAPGNVEDLMDLENSVLNTFFVIYRKRSNMRRVFVIFLAIYIIAFSLDRRFVCSRCSLGPSSLWEERRLMIPNSG